MFKIQKYYAVFKIAAIHALKNYKALIGLSIFLITCLVIFAHLWEIAATKAGAVALNPAQLLWYIAFNEWLLVSLPDVHDQMEQDLRTGRLAYLISRPISYLGSTFAEAFGVLCVNLSVLGAVTFIFTWSTVGSLPFHPIGLFFSLGFGLFAGCIAIIFLMIIGVSGFWLHEVAPFHWLWEKLLFLCGGLILPLTIYPLWMQKVAYLTPFPAILGERSSLALDFSMNQVLTILSALIIWGILGLCMLVFAYRRGLRILNIEGG